MINRVGYRCSKMFIFHFLNQLVLASTWYDEITFHENLNTRFLLKYFNSFFFYDRVKNNQAGTKADFRGKLSNLLDFSILISDYERYNGSSISPNVAERHSFWLSSSNYDRSTYNIPCPIRVLCQSLIKILKNE